MFTLPAAPVKPLRACRCKDWPVLAVIARDRRTTYHACDRSQQKPSGAWSNLKRDENMKKLLHIAIASAVLAAPAYAALEAGAQAPQFTAPASLDGKEFTYSLKEALSEGPTVVYFYPSAYTMGCNIQARTFALNMDKFKEAGASVVGVSLDSIDRLNDFSADPEYCAGKLPVVSDADGSIAASYDINVMNRAGATDTRGVAIDHGFAERTTFIVSPEGKVVGTVGGVSPEENVMQSLQLIQQLSAR